MNQRQQKKLIKRFHFSGLRTVRYLGLSYKEAVAQTKIHYCYGGRTYKFHSEHNDELINIWLTTNYTKPTLAKDKGNVKN